MGRLHCSLPLFIAFYDYLLAVYNNDYYCTIINPKN